MQAETNPFLVPSELPFAFPPFDRIRHEHYREAFDVGVAEQRAEIEAIVADPEEPTFANTVEALERSGQTLGRMLRVYENLGASLSTEEMRALQAELAPLLAKHEDEIRLDPRLFARVDAVHATRDPGLTSEQKRGVGRYHQDFVRAGAALPESERDRLRTLNVQITSLTTEFGNRVLAEANSLALHVTDRADLDGLSDNVVESAATAASSACLDGYLLPLVLPTIQPAMSALTNRDVRRRLHEAATIRGVRGGENDTPELVTDITRLRAERAALLGYPDHAAYVVADQTAGTSQAVLDMLHEMAGPAMRNLEDERARLEELIAADGVDGPLQPWDWAFYAALDKAATYDVDPDALRPYFELQRVLHDGIFRAASRLYGLSFRERHDLPVYADEVRVFEVLDEDGSTLGLFVCDWFARPTKQGGAWMDEFVEQSGLLGTRPVVVVCLNIPQQPAGQLALLTTDEVRTTFHEFGHALHGLLSDVRYPRIAGTAVPRDFVEFPSQVNEMWAWSPEVLSGYAVHHETGEPLQQEVVDRLVAAQADGQGFDTVSMLGASLLDQEWHRRDPHAPRVAPQDVEAFEAQALAAHSVASPLVPPRYRSGYFAHAFAGGHDANYYSYLWSEVLDADLVDWFEEHGGLTRENGDRFRAALLSRGGAVDPMAAFEAVRGRPPSTEPLLRRRGLL